MCLKKVYFQNKFKSCFYNFVHLLLFKLFVHIFYKNLNDHVVCGQENIQNKVLIVNGTKAKYGTAPWNVGIYYRKDDTKEFFIICGGSLISLNLVVSGKYSVYGIIILMKDYIRLFLAAHCFSDGEVREIPITILYHQYKIAAGKYKRDFNVIDNEFTQFFDVCY